MLGRRHLCTPTGSWTLDSGDHQASFTMATQQPRTLARLMMAPSVGLLLVWMIVPLSMTLWFSFQNYNLLNPADVSFGRPVQLRAISIPTRPSCQSILEHAADRRRRAVSSPSIGGVLLAHAARPADVRTGDRPDPGDLALLRHAARRGADLEEHDHASRLRRARGHQPSPRPDSLSTGSRNIRCLSIIIIVAWQWLPFATLILLTALQSLDGEQKEAAEMDGARLRRHASSI